MYKRQDWYYQKKAHKENLWYKQLPSQTAQETCKQLDKAWKSFYVLKKTGGIKAPNPPRFKQDNIPVTYMQMGIRHEKGSDQLRLSLPKDLKSYMEETYGIHEKFLYLPCLIILPDLCIKSLGRQGQSKSCKAISLS